MVPLKTIMMRTTRNIHVYQERATTVADHFNCHGTTTMEQPETT